mmetsp:Transcript_2727/g.3749  ORF Transcript_2727/g.3749 Transcript_2727/m.3749 type:complete len:552 (+) Transcript_2727:233-1888(+)|eukprot:CAMPEP_0197297920 /NCGR_PEP_ID=MMETSP0890-20130614/42301_1 /TAXON_ID=44058 ORGANISM="Aureoumbra lagunensis, Strain CCMP1510" /NCGR_SAMPLE_ID=MMETSP0890 /ASSEMBLY_ACC=CAM_ASM_000533 /LENGTH=551 /DNA_ID=CAMNT_0042775325 /DNA_START=179 /DNA_END=1834 /DNA_ORIENTATION=-
MTTKENDEEIRSDDDSGALVKSMVYGGLDGIITTFAIVATVAGARGHAGLVLVIGAANLIADALSMGVGDYLSERAEDEYIESAQTKRKYLFRTEPEKCAARLQAAYVRAGLTDAAATDVVRALGSRENIVVAHSMLFHDNLLPHQEWKSCDRKNIHEMNKKNDQFILSIPMKKGLTTFISFVLFGATPLATYYIMVLFFKDPAAMFTASCIVTTTTLIALGAAKAKFTNQPLIDSAMGMLVNGGAAAVAAFIIGRYLEEYVAGPAAAEELHITPEPVVLAATHHAANSEYQAAPIRVFFETCIAAAFAGVGALPCFFMPKVAPRFMAITNACAGGAVTAVAVALLVDAASDGKMGAACGCGLGLAAVSLAKFLTPDEDDTESSTDGPTGHSVASADLCYTPGGTPKKTSPVVAVALASHSLAEGLALGAAYSKSAVKGRTACLSILIHNIPEGLATAAVVVGRGESPLTALFFALASVAPQPLAAVLASHFASLFTDLANLFVAFAAAMMFWIAFSELIPDALLQALPSDRPNLALLATACGLAISLGVA